MPPRDTPPTDPPKEAAERTLLEVRKAIKSPDAVERDSLGPLEAALVRDQETDTELKRKYAHWMIIILAIQLLAMNVIFFLVGLGWLTYDDPWYLKTFMSGTLTEVFGVVLVITRYLFSKGGISTPKAPQSPLTTKRGR